MFEGILTAGVHDDLPKYLSKKVYISNMVALVSALLIALPYSVLSYFLFRPIMFVPLIATVICGFGIFLNYLGLNKIGRLTIGLLPLLLAEVFVAYLVPPGGKQLFSMYVVVMGFSVTPFLVFDLRERTYIVISSLLILLTFLFLSDWLNAHLISTVDTTIITDGPLGLINIFLGVSFMIVNIIILSNENFKSEQTSELLISEMDQKSEEVKKSESDLKAKILEIEKNQIEEKKRNWATQGIADVSTILRSDQEGGKLYDKITSYVTEYLKANQCGLFLVESDEHQEKVKIRLKSCYAYDRKKFLEKEFDSGQGLIGQVYLEKETIYLKDVPTGYISVTSGLGESIPNEVLIVPLIVNDEVEGVLEFASFAQFEDYQIQFVEQLGETLAAFINFNRINEKTKLLLEDSQQQAEEMRSQEEEMRQNMEEISATQEEMSRKEQEYLSQIEGLKKELESVTIKA